MEKRLTAQGPPDRKSYTVTLPIEWVKKNKLDKKRSIDLAIVGKKIVLSAEGSDDSRLLLPGDEYQEILIKVLQGVYRLGWDEVKITYSKAAVLKEVEEILDKNLLGYEIIDVKDTYVLIKDIIKDDDEEFKVILRRIFLLLIELSDAKNEIKRNTLDRNIKKLINYSQRIIIKKGHKDIKKTPIYYLLLDRLEKIGDEFRWCLELSVHQKEYDELVHLFREAYELFYQFESEKYARLQQRTYTLWQELKLDKKNDHVLIHLHTLVRLENSIYGEIFILSGE
jgi:hypothetical protein